MSKKRPSRKFNLNKEISLDSQREELKLESTESKPDTKEDESSSRVIFHIYEEYLPKCPEYPQSPLEHIVQSGENLIKSGDKLIGKVQESSIRTTPKGKPKKEFVCIIDDCKKVYSKASHLRDHSRSHRGERPFICSWPDCRKNFTRSDELQRHFRTHTKEKNYSCHRCEKKFSRSDHLKKHLNSHLRFDKICKTSDLPTNAEMSIFCPSIEIKEEPEYILS